ncbi:MAG: phytanoyl-CoA dioxygenase family protein [Pseudomonadota bacterium]
MGARDFGDVRSVDVSDGLPGADAVEAYNADGVICLRGAFDQAWLDTIEQGISQALNGASSDMTVVKSDDDKGHFSFSSQAWREVPPFKSFIFESRLPDLCWPFLQSQTLTLFYDFLLIKQASSKNAGTPWHQDHAFYPLTGRKVINCWTALDDIPRETALRYVRGSHRTSELTRAIKFDNSNEDYKFVRRERPPVPDIDNDPEADIITTAMQAGDMLVWNSHLYHAAPGNHLDARRAAFSVNWAGDDVRFEDVPAIDTYTAPHLKTGDRIECDKFPLVRSA